MIRYPALLVIFFCLLFFLLPSQARAQVSYMGIAETYKVTGSVEDGDLVSLTDTEEELALSRTDNDEKLFGVVRLAPLIVLRRPGRTIPVVRTGQTQVQVTTLGGPIVIGDYISPSSIPGKGRKATNDDEVSIGIAMSAFDGAGGKTIEVGGKQYSVGTVMVNLDFTGGGSGGKSLRSLVGVMSRLSGTILSGVKNSREADRMLRAIVAGAIALGTIFVNFYTFGRNITKGIEAIGRNPMARVSIQSMIIMNVMLIAIISIAGIFFALAILNL